MIRALFLAGLLIGAVLATAHTHWIAPGLLYMALAAVALLIFAGLFHRHVLSERAATRNRARALRWRIKLRLRPGPGYASLAELVSRWGRLAAVHHGGRARPGLTLVQRVRGPVTGHAVRLGRAQYFRRALARMEDQRLILAPQRVGKSGLIADWILDHPGPVLATSTRPDLYALTRDTRVNLGPVRVFNPQGIGNVSSTVRFDLLDPCRDLVMARRMATWLAGADKNGNLGNIEWFSKKGDVALGGLLFAAAVTGATIIDVFRWVQLDGQEDALRALAEHGTPEMLAVVRRMLAENRTAGSVRDTIELSLSWAAIPALAAAVTPVPGDRFDADQFIRECGTLYMIAGGDEESPVTPLFRAMASYTHYQAGLTGTRARHGRLDPPLLMALDEVAVTCPIDLPGMLADSAGKGVLMTAVVHSYSQLEDRWGKHGAATIWSTCGTKLLLPGISNEETLEVVSKLCGTITIGTGEDKATVPVVPVELIRSLPDWRALVLRMNLSPVVVRIRPAWKRRENRWWFRALHRRGTPVPVVLPVPVPLPAAELEPEPLGEPVPAAMNGHGRELGPLGGGQ